MGLPCRGASKVVAVAVACLAMLLATSAASSAGTKTAPPVVESWTPTWITNASALLNAGVTAGGLDTQTWFQYGTAVSYGDTTVKQDAGSSTSQVAISYDVTELSPGTTYHFRLAARNSKGTRYGSDGTFTTTGAAYTLPPSGPRVVSGVANGWVVLAFDDGPYTGTPYLLQELKSLGLHAYFFDVGQQIQAYPTYMQDELAAGDPVENHTWDHQSLTDAIPPLTGQQVSVEFTQTNQIIVSKGGTFPTLWRAPYGETDADINSIADGLGLTGVSSYGPGCIDSTDWEDGATAAQISSSVDGSLSQYIASGDVKRGVELEFHDGVNTQQAINALPTIAAYLNANRIGSSLSLPAVTEFK